MSENSITNARLQLGVNIHDNDYDFMIVMFGKLTQHWEDKAARKWVIEVDLTWEDLKRLVDEYERVLKAASTTPPPSNPNQGDPHQT